MKGLKKRVLAALCVVTMLTGVIWQGGLQQVANAAEESTNDFAREWEIIGADDPALTVVDIDADSVVKAGSKSNCNINLPDDISEGNLALYVKLNVVADETSLTLLNSEGRTYIELCNEKADSAERNWKISSQGDLKDGENKLVLRFDASSFHHGENGMFPFDYQETINFFRFYTTAKFEENSSCTVEVTELRIVYTNAGLEFGQDGDDTYLQLSNKLSENPTTIEASIKKELVGNSSEGWTLAKMDGKTIANSSLGVITCEEAGLEDGTTYEEITLEARNLFIGNKFATPQLGEYALTSIEDLPETKLAIAFWLYCNQETTMNGGEAWFNLSSANAHDGSNNLALDIRANADKNQNTDFWTYSEGWNYVEIPLNRMTVNGNPDVTSLKYMRFYTVNMTGTFRVTDVKMVVTGTNKEWPLITVDSTDDDTELISNSTNGVVVGEQEGKPVIYTEYEKVSLSDAKLSIESTYDIRIPTSYVTEVEHLASNHLAVAFWLYSSVATTLGDGQLELNSSGTNNEHSEIRYQFKKASNYPVEVGWNYVKLPLNQFTYDVSGKDVDIANLNYVRLYTDKLTGEFAISDIKLIVNDGNVGGWTIAETENYTLTTGATMDSVGSETDTLTVDTNSAVPQQGTKYAYVTDSKLSASASVDFSSIIDKKNDASVSEVAVKARGEMYTKKSSLAVAFWLYCSQAQSLGSDTQVRLGNSTSNYIRYMNRQLVDLEAGWNYLVLPINYFFYDANNFQDFNLSDIKYFQFYTNTVMNGTVAISDAELLVLDEHDEWTIRDAYRYDSQGYSGSCAQAFFNTAAKMGIAEGDGVDEPFMGSIYAETTCASQQLRFDGTFASPIPTGMLQKGEVTSGAYGKIAETSFAVDFWFYSSVDGTALGAEAQFEFSSQGSTRDASNRIYYKVPNMGIEVGWNHIVLALKDFTYCDNGKLDLNNLNYVNFFTTATNGVHVSGTFRVTDIKIIDTNENAVKVTKETYINDNQYMIFSNTDANDENQSALMVTEEGYLAYVEGTTQYTLEQNVCTGDWVDVAVVRDTEKIIFYIDGEEAGYCSANARTDTAPNAKHSIGSDGTGSQLFDGSICDVRIWNDVRTSDEIKNNLVDKNTVALTSNNLDMTDESLIGSWFLVGDIQYVLDIMPDNVGGNHAVFCGSRANDWVDYTVPEELGEDYWSMVFIPDIQNLVTGKYTRLWYDMADWIAANVEKENIQHVIGAGDSTWSNIDNEYKYAKNGFDRFTDLVSWSNMIGNHDYVWEASERNSLKYNSVFGTDYINSTYSRFTYEGSFEDATYNVSGVENSYYTFTVNGVHWMILQLEYYPRQNVLTWANDVITEHPNHNVILTTHSYLDGKGSYATNSMEYTANDANVGGSLGESTETIWDSIIAPNANVKMVLCGHSTNGEGAIATKKLTNDAGNEVTALMMNVQDLDMTDSNGADTAYYSGQALGAVNILRFSADGTKVAVQQYAPGYDKSFGTSSNAIQLSLETESCEPVIVERETGVNAGTAPEEKDGYVFAGWFTDEACTTAIAKDATNTNAFAKYVDAEVHSIKAQVSLLEEGETDLTRDIRFVTTVDSENYESVGFEITMKSKTKLVGTEDKVVYKKLYAMNTTDKVLEYEPYNAFCEKAVYFKTYTISGIPYTVYDTESITVRAYWKTLDGTEVYGEAVTKTIQEYLQLEDVGNLDKATLYGRTVINEDGELDLFWTNSGLAFNFNGTGAKATITTTSTSETSYGYLNIYVDGETSPSKTICLTEAEGTYTLAEGLNVGEHTIEIRKRNEAVFGNSATITIQSLAIDNGRFIQQPATSKNKIEVIGDSITSGYGNMITDGTGTFSTSTEDGTNTYAVLAAKQLGADVSIVSRSGIGFCRGTANCDSIFNYYTKTAALPRNELNNKDWDFSQNQNDVVVINLGTNDNNATIGGTKVTDEYITSEAVAFLELVREKNPSAVIIWTYGMMGNERESAISAAVDERNASGDENVYYLSFTKLDSDIEGIGVASHPTIATHAARSTVLAEFIAEKTGWTIME